jgi:hypothetical protein
MRISLFSFTFLALSYSSCLGANFLINVSSLGDGMGGLAPTGSTLIGVASVSDGTFDDPPIGDFVGGGSDDVVLFSKALTGEGTLTGTTGDIKFADHAGFDSSDPVRFVWFPALPSSPAPDNIPSRNPQAGETFVFSTNEVMLANDTDAFNTITFSQGNIAATQSSGLVVPEPSSVTLLLIGAMSLFVRRRR